MKTFVRARRLAAMAMKSVAAVVEGNQFSISIPVVDFEGMEMNELREMAKEEGITRAGKDEFDLRDGLEKEYELYPSDV